VNPSYVDQNETLLPWLTVRETVEFAARLRLPGSLPRTAVMDRVDGLLRALRIAHVADRYVGGAGARGISGGERRRVAIACELVTLPAVLFMDEPTSGLDANSALVVMAAVRALSRAIGTAVVCSIHQPRSNLFNLFDTALVLGHGSLLYAGAVSAVLPFLADAGHPCPPNYNPADHLVDLAAGASAGGAVAAAATAESTTEPSVDPLGGSQPATVDGAALEMGVVESPSGDGGAPFGEAELAAAYRSSGLFKALCARVDEAFRESRPEEADDTAPAGGTGAKALGRAVLEGFRRFGLLCRRTAIAMERDPLLLVAHYCMAVFLGLLLGGLFWQADFTISGIQNRLGFIFFSLAIFLFSAIASLEARCTRPIGPFGAPRRPR